MATSRYNHSSYYLWDVLAGSLNNLYGFPCSLSSMSFRRLTEAIITTMFVENDAKTFSVVVRGYCAPKINHVRHADKKNISVYVY